MKPDLAITREKKRDDGFTHVEIDTKKATYQGHRWKDMDSFGRRKFENYLILSRSHERLRIHYE